MNSHFQFQYPWVLGLLALLPEVTFVRRFREIFPS